jgi:LysM repeat protein
MIKTVKVELTIRDEKTGKYYPIPVLPERIEYAEGDKQADTVNIIDLGEVDFLSGVALDNVGWSSFFPGRYDAGYVSVRNPLSPTAYKKLFDSWKDNGTPLRLICPAAGINKQVYLSAFTWDLRGFEGDIYYNLNLKERKTIKPIQLSVTRPAPSKSKKTPAKRPAKTAATQPKYYVVKKGDWLIKIAKKYNIKDWRKQLYEPNKKPKGPLGPNPDLIYPGQKLKLP